MDVKVHKHISIRLDCTPRDTYLITDALYLAVKHYSKMTEQVYNTKTTTEMNELREKIITAQREAGL